MYQDNSYVSPNGFILQTPVYQRLNDFHRNQIRTFEYSNSRSVTYPPPLAQRVISGPGAISGPGPMHPVRGTQRNNYDSDYRTPNTGMHQPPWSNPPAQRYYGGQQNLSRKRVFDNNVNEQPTKRKRRRDDDNGSSSKKKKDTSSIPCTQTPQTSKNATPSRVPPTGTSLTDTDMLSKDIWEHFLERKQTKADLRRKVALRNDLATVIQFLYPYGGLFLVGSSMNGFGSTDSDVDMCLMISNETISQKHTAKMMLQRILVELSRRSFHFVRKPLVIPAKVPILKFYDCLRKIECDLNINNATGIRNTYLMQLYSKLDWRVAPLILAIKKWASDVGINDASKGTLSSYSVVLMVLYYLQVGAKPPVLISLQQKYPQKFLNSISVWDLQNLAPEDQLPSWINFESRNKQSFCQLLDGFMSFYTKDFHFYKDVVSVRLGRPLLLSSIETVGDWKKKFIHIEEPFDKTNTARAVYSEQSFRVIIRAMNKAAKKLSKPKNLKVNDLCLG
ncbi:poly(A) RNA polymerase GLD2-like [Antedon mediterranea]|uniref:poly(A) RNA polymerase GLD2-like n=1 Tax=Antedon mediterranea TaxID=105859 RepID=UPI003AF76607